MGSQFKRRVAKALIVTVLALSSGLAEATLAPASLPGDAAVRTQNIQTVQQFLEQKEVSQHLTRFNLTPSEVEARLSNLSDQELHQVATRIHQQQPGGDGAGVLVTVLVVGILVLLFVYLLERV